MEAFTGDKKRRAGGVSGRLFVLSALSPDDKFEAALVPPDTRSGLQSLLGWDGQLHAFAAMLRRLGIACLFTPAPEMFFTPTAARIAEAAAGIAPSALDTAIHIRFGAGRHARLLRGIPNLIATAESAWTGILATSTHAFRDQNTAPHAFQAMLDLSGQAGPLTRPDGTAIAPIAVPPSVSAADLPRWRQTARPLTRVDFAGLHIMTLAEFDPLDATGVAASLQARRLMTTFNAAGGAPRRLLLLPWNLANPASCAPDLAIKYLRAAAGADQVFDPVLLPFNADKPFAAQIAPHIERLRRQLAAIQPNPPDFEPPPLPPALMIGRVTDLTAIPTLHRLGAVAWVDGADPEAAWTAARLTACAIPTLRLPPGAETTMTESRDEFGQRFFAGRTLPARDIPALAKASDSLSPAPADPPAPQTRLADWSRFIRDCLAAAPAITTA